MTTFSIGDFVEVLPGNSYIYTTGGQQGVIIALDYSKNYSEATIQFTRDSWKSMHKDSPRSEDQDRTYAILTRYLRLGSFQNKEDKIKNRIKKLWNESNYVKNNPALQY